MKSTPQIGFLVIQLRIWNLRAMTAAVAMALKIYKALMSTTPSNLLTVKDPSGRAVMGIEAGTHSSRKLLQHRLYCPLLDVQIRGSEEADMSPMGGCTCIPTLTHLLDTALPFNS